jgi:hypothetical protein
MESVDPVPPQPPSTPQTERLRTARPAEDIEEAEPRRHRIARIYIRVLIFLFVYVFSTGPLYWACYEGLRDAGTVDNLLELPAIGILYYPIAWLCQVPAISRWFDWYINLWL